MSVNVAARQLAQPDFVCDVVRILDDTGLPSDRLCLEITESVVLTDLQTVTERLLAIRDLGVRIAIDDFGTGYSSLSYLSRLPVDVLKVDKSFVDRVMVNEQDATLTMAIIAMGRTMNLTTVAEGVESTDQARWLADAKCAYGQGYLWSPPVSVSDAHVLLETPSAVA
jgi:EAL domain-containing protein (putative c-di-GMP-specific phosphodiesterase class I)